MKRTVSTGINREFSFSRPGVVGRAGLWMAGMLFAASAAAASGVTVDNAWVRATKSGQSSVALQFSVTSAKAAKLVAISTPGADSVEIHSMTHDNGKMEMRKLESLPLPTGKRLDLKGSGNHIMLNGLKRPLKAGDSLPFALTVQYADGSKETVEADAEVRSAGGGMGGGSHDMHGM